MEALQEKSDTDNKNLINEKVKNKLKEYSEFKCLYNISNGAVRYKRNISLIVQERVEKNLNINPKKNNYYSGSNPSVDVFNLKSVVQSVFGDYVKRNNIDVPAEVTKMENEFQERYQQMGKTNKPYGSIMKKKLVTIKDQNQVNESGGGDKRKTRKNYALYVIKDKKKKSIEKNDKVKTDALNNNSNHQIFVRNTNCKRRSVLDKMTKKEIERREKEENENNKKEDEKKNNMIVEIKNNNKDKKEKINPENNEKAKEAKIAETEKNKEVNNINIEKEVKTIIKNNSKKDFNKENNKENIKDNIKDINKDNNKENIKDNNKENKTIYSESSKDIKKVNSRRKKENMKLNINFINSIKNDFEEKERDERCVTSENRSFVRQPRYYGKKEIRSTSKKKKPDEVEIKKQKSYTYKRKEQDEIKSRPEAKKIKYRFKNYRSRSKSNKKIERKDNININKDEGPKKSRSAKKYKGKRKHHRHHHFQHFKRPHRIIAISNIDSFSIMQFN